MADKGRPKTASHVTKNKIAVLLLNLGTPDAPTPSALRRYLGQFLADPRVVEVPRLLWRIILHGVILRIRPRRSAKAYQAIWTNEGSPLLLHTAALSQALGRQLNEQLKQSSSEILVSYAMRYGSPAIPTVLAQLLNQGVNKLLVLPLYPQYSGSTTASMFDALADDFKQRRCLPDVRFISRYYNDPAYIQALASSIRQYQAQHGVPDKLVLSYHGIPQSYVDKGDPYYDECYETSHLVAAELGLADDAYITTFQSRFGREPWLQPYTDKTLQSLPSQGVKSIQVICPGFAADCLETLEEIDQENRGYFMAAGGEQFHYIPCLNATKEHTQALTAFVLDNLQGWTAPVSADCVKPSQHDAHQ